MFVPLNINLKNKVVLIIGGGKIALQKAKYFEKYGCIIKIVAPEIHQELLEKDYTRGFEILKRRFEEEDLKDAGVVIITTDDRRVNQNIVQICNERGLLFNDCTQKERSEISIPALIKRGDLSITVSTNGKSPSLSRKIKSDIERLYGEEYDEFLTLLGELRVMVLEKEKDKNRKRDILKESINLSIEGLREYILKYKGEGI